MLLLDDVEQLQPVQPAALQPDIEEDEVRPPRGNRRQRLVEGRGVIEFDADPLPHGPFTVPKAVLLSAKRRVLGSVRGCRLVSVGEDVIREAFDVRARHPRVTRRS